ncbi:MAG: hypothetical protein WBD41_00180 [Rhodococcus sp. (in: high G+C Gram-positive bacteria)]|jgi:hypothetical protein|uniref:hypothetical protein n=1 Tax=Rhodococcus sp. EPR-157 TaxID=1813677 RepID=UPI0007BB77B1|nr:hypothetical protein [Rhodococcus sp. EPR-157]KZF00086.1 hypothetical protein A2J03_10925 [Rhodococcus sp. EPR-157]
MDRQRSAVALLASTGVLFAIYPILRPYSSEVGRAGADAFASPLWIAAHVSAMIGFITLVLALRALNVGTVADVTTLVGVGLVLPYYGAETFALNVLGTDALDTGDYTVVDLAEPIRYGMTQSVMFGVGLVAIATGAVLAARRSACWQGWVFAAGFVLFLPQFFAPPWLRIAHGLLILAGAALLAARTFERQEISTTTGA